MRIYLVKRILGYYMGEFRSLDWTDREPFILPKEIGTVAGIPDDIQLAYMHYLARLGTFTFGYFDGIPTALPQGKRMVEEFMKYHLYKLWAEYGRQWWEVGAYAMRFSTQDVVSRPERFEPAETSRILAPYNIILRYREMLWWGRSVFQYDKFEWLYEMGPVIGEVLMFERRGYGVAKKYDDSWNFGMLWWELFGVPGRFELYLWAAAEVKYIGMGIRKSAKMLSMQVKKPS